MRNLDDLHYRSLIDLAGAIGRGEISSEAVTGHLLDRIDRVDPRLHSYVTLLRDDALAQARCADAEIHAGWRRGPLHGVPVAIKDLLFTAAAPTTAGSNILGALTPRWNATVVDRLERAGAVLLGKLATTEGALSEHPSRRPVPVNPWHADYWTGISSSGSGVATAAGLCFAALGTDTGGSIRVPSSACGLTGLKPTYGRVSRHGLFPMCEGRDHIGPMARSAADAAALLGVIAGPDPKDPTALQDPVGNYLATIDDGIEGVRIGFDPQILADLPDDRLKSAIEHALQTFEALGAHLREIAYPSPDAYLRDYFAETAAEVAIAHAPFFAEHADDYGAVLRKVIEAGATVSGQDVVRVQQQRMKLCGAFARLFTGIDLLALPLMPQRTQTVAAMAAIDPPAFIRTHGRFTLPFNSSGHPALVLPCGADDLGLPLSVQLVGRHVEEALLFRAGHAFQQATAWHIRHPDIG